MSSAVGGRAKEQGLLNPPRQIPGRDPEQEGKTPSSCPLGAQHDPVWPLPWPLLAFSAWRGAEPSGLALADTQMITLPARAIREMLNLGKAHGTDRLSLSPLSWGRGTDLSLGRRNSLITCGCLPGE